MNTPLFIIGILILVYALFLGIFWTIRSYREQKNKAIIKEDLPATNNDISAIREMMAQQHEDLVKIIERMDRRIALLEERNGNENG